MLSFLATQIAGRAIKATAGAIATAIGGMGTAALALPTLTPADADLTITGYIIVGALNGAIGWATVYFAPANKPR